MSAKRAPLFNRSHPAAPTALADTPASQPVSLPASSHVDVPARAPYPKASTRQGKKSITVYVEPETMKQLRRMLRDAEDEGRAATMQDLMIEAINALFASKGMTRLAA